MLSLNLSFEIMLSTHASLFLALLFGFSEKSLLLLALPKLFLALSLLLSADSLGFETFLFGLFPFSFFLFFALFFYLVAHIFKRDLLNQVFVLTHFGEFLTAAETAAKWEGRLRDIEVRWWMMYSKWAVVPIAVLNH